MQPRIAKGYIRGKEFDIIVTERFGKLIEVSTALVFDLMGDAAWKAGVDLRLVSGFRTNEEQQWLWSERADPMVRSVKGVAAKPGWSNHQSGSALDLHVGMSLADLRSGKKSDVFKWLEAHAADFGFKRTVPSEPWHWERVPLMEDRA